MPIYEYKCASCSKIFELFVMSSKDLQEIRCPQCNSDSIKRIMSSYSAFGTSSTENGYNDSGSSYPSCGCNGQTCGI